MYLLDYSSLGDYLTCAAQVNMPHVMGTCSFLISINKATPPTYAAPMGTKESNVSRLEKGTGNPTIKTLMKYAKACGCQLDFGFTHA
ncbi:helix-turn-helix domain-containing protein [Vibrio sp. 10N.222.54.A1]|uniref:Helix-turn-helix domain-containing protein n=1 Tax=Vibrio cyclitrophicus TaxID=47951 RepID=A0ACD5G5D8_9VIBR|nr:MULTISPECIES: helix-turn-helix transcriptional regulator [Vibrio]